MKNIYTDVYLAATKDKELDEWIDQIESYRTKPKIIMENIVDEEEETEDKKEKTVVDIKPEDKKKIEDSKVKLYFNNILII